MTTVVAAVREVERLVEERPVIVGGLAVLCRLSSPYRATTDLDVVDRGTGGLSQLEVLRSSTGAREAGPAGVMIPTPFGEAKVDVLEVRQVELDDPSDDPTDRLHASSHAWAFESATDVVLCVVVDGVLMVEATVPVAEPGPLVAMKLQAVMDRGAEKQGTDLQDIVRLLLDRDVRDRCLDQIERCPKLMALDIAEHAELWFDRKGKASLRAIHATGGEDIRAEDLDVVLDLLMQATRERDS